MRQLPPLNWLRAFEAAGRLASFSKAAEELCVTPSAISQQIRKLEEWCGVMLFNREGSGVQLTKQAGALFQELNTDLERIADHLQALRAAPVKNQVRVAVIPSVGSRLLIPKIRDFQDANPGINLSILYTVARNGIDLSELDVLITYLDGPYDGPYSASVLLAGDVRPVCAPSYLARAPRAGNEIDFSAATLLHDEDGSTWSRWLHKRGVASDPINSSTIFADFNLLSIAVIAGHGVALCPTSLINAELATGDLVLLSDLTENCDRNYFLFQHHQRNDAVDRFCVWVKQALLGI